MFHTIEAAPETGKPLLETSLKNNRRIPGRRGTMAGAPPLLAAYNVAHQKFPATSLTDEEKPVVWHSVNVAQTCYCRVPGHTGIAKMMKVDDAITEALRNETPLPTAKLEALRTFALVVVRNRGFVADADTQVSLDAGYSEANILDVVLGVAQKVMSSYTNHVANTPVDTVFERFAWTPVAQAAEQRHHGARSRSRPDFQRTGPIMTLRIDIVSDVVCPWCVIGYRQLARALDETAVAHELHWHPFELNPQMPPEGQNLRDHVIEKYGTTPDASERDRARITALGAELGFDFRFTDDMRMHNTFRAHQLLHWADTLGAQHELELALFTAHFTHRRDLSDTDVLADIAAENGLDRDEARAVLTDQRFAAEVRAMENFWLSKGIRGVPSVIFKLRDLVTGAQGVETYMRMIEESAKQEA